MSGCFVVRGVVWCGSPFPSSSFPLLSSFPWWVCVWVGWVGWACVWVRGVGWACVCVCVGLGVLIDVAAPQRGDRVKQVIYDLAKTATKNFSIKNVYHHIINQINFVYFVQCVQLYERNSYF